MLYTFTGKNKYNRKIQPVFQRFRTKYRFSRSSQNENSETNNLKIDITRINNSLNDLDKTVFDDLKILVGDIKDLNEELSLTGGLSYTISGVDFYNDNSSELIEDIDIDVTNKLSSIISRIELKVSRLERNLND